MPERFDSGVYSPELAALMKASFSDAWKKLHVLPQDKELAPLLLASAIIDQVDAGLRDQQEIAARAVAALVTAKNISGETA